MQNYPAELVETPRPLCFVLSELGGEGGIGDRLIAALMLAEENMPRENRLGSKLRYKSVPLTHRFARKKDNDLEHRALDGCPLDTYVVRGFLKTAWLRRQFLERPGIVVVTRRMSSVYDVHIPESLVGTLNSLRLDLAGRDVCIILVIVIPNEGQESPESLSVDGVAKNGTPKIPVVDTRTVDTTTSNTTEQANSQATGADKFAPGNVSILHEDHGVNSALIKL